MAAEGASQCHSAAVEAHDGEWGMENGELTRRAGAVCGPLAAIWSRGGSKIWGLWGEKEGTRVGAVEGFLVEAVGLECWQMLHTEVGRRLSNNN